MVNETDEYQSEEGDTEGNAGSISTAQKKKKRLHQSNLELDD